MIPVEKTLTPRRMDFQHSFDAEMCVFTSEAGEKRNCGYANVNVSSLAEAKAMIPGARCPQIVVDSEYSGTMC